MQSIRISLAVVLALAVGVGAVAAQETKPAATKPAAATKASSTAAAEGPSAKNPPKKTDAKAKKPAPVDINSANAEQLKTIPGITDAQAEKIVKNRPYPTRSHLVTKDVLTYDEYMAIKDRLVAHPAGAPPAPAKAKK